MKHFVHMLGLFLVAFSLAVLPLPAAGAKAGMACCDGMEMAGALSMDHSTMTHLGCPDQEDGATQPDCCKPVAHAPAALLLDESVGTPPTLFTAFFARPVAVPESALSGLRTPPPNA